MLFFWEDGIVRSALLPAGLLLLSQTKVGRVSGQSVPVFDGGRKVTFLPSVTVCNTCVWGWDTLYWWLQQQETKRRESQHREILQGSAWIIHFVPNMFCICFHLKCPFQAFLPFTLGVSLNYICSFANKKQKNLSKKNKNQLNLRRNVIYPQGQKVKRALQWVEKGESEVRERERVGVCYALLTFWACE